MNQIMLSGRLVKEPELRYTQTGTAIYSNAIAVDDGYGDNKKTYFIDITAFQKTAENAAQWTFKGQRVIVTGKLVKRSYDNAEGKKVYVTEVHVQQFEYMDFKEKKETEQQRNPFDAISTPVQIDEDDIPF